MFANNDVREFVECLLKHNVRFVLIGGYAVIYYTEPRYTKDIDFLVDASAENALRIIAALQEFGVPSDQLPKELFEHKGNFFKIGKPPWRIDLITSIEGLNFKDIYNRSLSIEVDGLKLQIASRKDLIASKTKANRPQDLMDIAALKRSSKSGHDKKIT